MNDKENVDLQGELTLPKEFFEKMKLLCLDWTDDTEVTATTKKSTGEEVPIQVFVSRILRYTINEDFEQIGDILLSHLLFKKKGFRIWGYVEEEDNGKKFPIDIIYLTLDEFGVYKIDLESDYKPPDNLTRHPSSN